MTYQLAVRRTDHSVIRNSSTHAFTVHSPKRIITASRITGGATLQYGSYTDTSENRQEAA